MNEPRRITMTNNTTRPEIEYVAIGDLQPYEKNPKMHSKQQIEMIAKSIKEFGFTSPIITTTSGMIVAGHARFAAAKELKMEEVPVIKLELSHEKAMAYVVADNRLSELGDFDVDLLNELLADIGKIPEFDLESTGYGQDVFDELLINAMTGLDEFDDIQGTLDIQRDKFEGIKDNVAFKYMSFGKYKVPMTDSEAEQLEKLYDEFADFAKNTYGFVTWIVRKVTANGE
jgi:hypothetical protein